MTLPSQILFEVISAATDTLVGGRVFAGMIPADKELPAIEYQIESTNPQYFTGLLSTATYDYQITVVADTYMEQHTIGQAILTALSTYQCSDYRIRITNLRDVMVAWPPGSEEPKHACEIGISLEQLIS